MTSYQVDVGLTLILDIGYRDDGAGSVQAQMAGQGRLYEVCPRTGVQIVNRSTSFVGQAFILPDLSNLGGCRSGREENANEEGALNARRPELIVCHMDSLDIPVVSCGEQWFTLVVQTTAVRLQTCIGYDRLNYMHLYQLYQLLSTPM